MDRQPRFVVLLVVSLALIPTGASAQTHQHDLPIDKKEKFVDLDPLQTETHMMHCNSSPTEIALNGSVKVDAVDSPGHPAFVDTNVSRGYGPRSWRFVVTNNNQRGRAQLKLFIVCMGQSFGGHSAVLSGPGTDPATAVAEDSAAFDTQGSIATGDAERLASCPGTPSGVANDPTMFPVRPGFAFDPSAGSMGVSEPLTFAFSGGGNPFGLQSRDWTFQFNTGGNDVATNMIASIRCLGTHSSTSSGHAHAYDVSYLRWPHNIRVPARTHSSNDVTLACPKRNGAFGIIGTYSEFGGARVVGSEPRGDVWAFRFSNPSASDAFVGIGLICVEKRTWHSNGSFPAPAPKPQTIETATTTKKVTVAGGVSPAAAKTFNVRCTNRSHYVLSGSVSIDSVSAGDIGVFDFISVPESRATGLGRWRFSIDNNSVGSAKISLRLVCVAPWTEGHSLAFSGVAEDRLQAGRVACGNGQFPVRAGYANREPSLSAPLLRGGKLRPSWRFAFVGGKADVSVSCLYERTTLRGNHHHRVFVSFKQKAVKVPAAQGKRATVRCPAGQRAIAGSVDARGTGARTVESHSIGRSWAFSLVSLRKAARVTVGATCLGAKSTGEIFD